MQTISSNKQLVEYLKSSFHLSKPAVEQAFLATDRKNFVSTELARFAYQDAPLPTLEGQTISAPGVVAIMSEALEVGKGMKVLEVGSGSGYQAAVLARLVGGKGRVFSIERHARLAELAKKNLAKEKIKNVLVVEGDGSKGLPREAPFDRIVVTAAARKIPERLVEQLKEGGRMVAPVGESAYAQELILLQKKRGVATQQKILDVVFVPLVEGK